MNTKNSRKKLCLEKETLRTLDADHLIDVAGGALPSILGKLTDRSRIVTVICPSAGGNCPSAFANCPTASK